MSKAERFRSRNALAASYIAYGMLVLFAAEEWLATNTIGFIRAAVALALVGEIIYLLMHRPAIVVSDEAIEIINPMSTTVIGWQDVESIDAKYTMSIETIDGERIYAWAASAPGRYHSRRIHPADVKGMQLDEVIRPGESPRADSGVAAHIARVRWRAFDGKSSVARTFQRNTRGAAIVGATAALLIILLNI